MDLFDNLSKIISNTVNKAAEKTKQITDTTVNASKLRTQQKNAEKNINNLYMQLGRTYYENSYESCDNIYRDIIAAIDREKEVLCSAEKELDSLNGVRRCPECNKEVGDDSRFCDGCGAKLDEIITEEPAKADPPENEEAANINAEEIVSEEITAETYEKTEAVCAEPSDTLNKKLCDNCGAEVPDWASYCTECGAKYK